MPEHPLPSRMTILLQTAWRRRPGYRPLHEYFKELGALGESAVDREADRRRGGCADEQAAGAGGRGEKSAWLLLQRRCMTIT